MKNTKNNVRRGVYYATSKEHAQILILEDNQEPSYWTRERKMASDRYAAVSVQTDGNSYIGTFIDEFFVQEFFVHNEDIFLAYIH